MKETGEKVQKDRKGVKPNREYKDSVFVDLLSVDEETRYDAAISLYNAMHKEKVDKKEKVRFIRLVNVLFRKVRNDVSFIVEDRLIILIEHQSTINENMPFRFLEYIVAIYETQLQAREKFSQKPLSLHAPEFYVIYNGKEPYPARKELRLSKLFKHSEKEVQLELVVTVININHPDNKDFLRLCPILKGYKELVERCEKYLEAMGEAGFKIAIEECIREGILKEYLKRKVREVEEMLSVEYSYAEELEASKMDGIEIGRAEGKAEGKAEGRTEGMYAKAVETAKKLLKMGLSLSDIMEATSLSEAEIAKL